MLHSVQVWTYELQLVLNVAIVELLFHFTRSTFLVCFGFVLQKLLIKSFKRLILFDFNEDLEEFLRIRKSYCCIRQRLCFIGRTVLNWCATAALSLLIAPSGLFHSLHFFFLSLFFLIFKPILLNLFFCSKGMCK